MTRNATTFRVIFKNSEQGEFLAHYLVRALGKRKHRSSSCKAVPARR